MVSAVPDGVRFCSQGIFAGLVRTHATWWERVVMGLGGQDGLAIGSNRAGDLRRFNG